MYDVMLDLETLGINSNAPILAIGAVYFNPESRRLGRTFYQAIELTSSLDSGAKIDASTVIWWMQQSEEARKVFIDNTITLTQALTNFSDFLNNTPNVKIWGNGSDFDNIILANSFDRVKFPLPWKFWNNRCYRTVKNLAPHIPIHRTGIHHNALDDAISQASHLIDIYANMEIKQ